MGDGSFNKGNLSFCTESFTLADQVRLINVLRIQYGLNPYIRPRSIGSNHWRIFFSINDLPKIITLVRPHMTTSMLYK